MKSIFKNHPDFVLVSLAIVFMAVLATSFIFGMQVLITSLNKACGFKAPENQAKAGFDLGGARALDLKGLVQ